MKDKLSPEDSKKIKSTISRAERVKNAVITAHRNKILKVIDSSIKVLEKSVDVSIRKRKPDADVKILVSRLNQTKRLRNIVAKGENNMLVFYLTLASVVKIMTMVAASVYGIMLGVNAVGVVGGKAASGLIVSNSLGLVNSVKMPEPNMLSPLSVGGRGVGVYMTAKSSSKVWSSLSGSELVQFFTGSASKIMSSNIFRIVSVSAAAFLSAGLVGILCHKLILIESGKLDRKDAMKESGNLIERTNKKVSDDIRKSAK